MSEAAVIVAAYNAEPFIAPTLDSVLSQDFDDIEVIVVDDGSRDGTGRVLEAYAAADKRVMVATQTNLGVSGARNTGLRTAGANTELVLFLDHDDVLLPGALSTLAETLRKSPAASAAHGAVTVIDRDGRADPSADPKSLGLVRRRLVEPGGLIEALKNGPLEMPATEPTTFASLVYTSCITSPGQVLIRRQALREAGEFDPATAPSDDWDLFLRIARVGPIAYADKPVLGWRRHDANASRDIALMKRSSLAVRNKLLNRSSNLTRAQLAVVRRQFAYTAIALLAAYLKRQPDCDLGTDLLPALRLYARSLATAASS
jgi:glycosyltransferase involved in cell wall biosynthesis